MKSETVPVPGADLYAEIRGDGPPLLLIPGGGGDAANFDDLAEGLAEHFTVIAYDVRGYSRSRLTSGHPEPQHVAVQADDAARIIETLCSEPAFVFGTSNGAITALDLLAHHPERVRTVVAHEPPCFAVLPTAAAHHAWIEEVLDLFHTEGLAAAGAHFLAGIGPVMDPTPQPERMTPRQTETWARLAANGPIMMEYELREFTSYIPDFGALDGLTDRLVLAAGERTRGHLPYRPAATIALRLGLSVTEFPGAHNGSRTHATEFAERLTKIFTERT
ncbi:alpha/beta fold hydrolase [Nocardia sp. NPDC003482]